ncbi:MAG: UDP-glucose/GDP-mannose dehydrogenase family protein, partial [Chloroflexales bacterium]|nr:UDP-glucose/GDP-mannose dehydrogenase family protein [Chloroflexales bacterium]
REVGAALASSPGHRTVVVRSTVMPGTLEEVVLPLLEQHSGMRAGVDFSLCMNPEFLREGSAIQDYYHPSYIVIGELDAASGSRLEPAYAAVGAPIIRTTLRVAEMLKYTCNAFHAVKVVFANEIGNLCKAHGIDGHDVMDIFCQDRQLNISPAYLRPGYSFGGSCLPKDLRALLYRARERDTDAPLLHAAVVSNEQQIRRAIELVERTGKRRVGVLGLSFKPGTDDIRESPVVPVIETLLGRGYRVSVFDEQVQLSKLIGRNKSYIEQQVPHIASLMRPSVDSLLADADVVVLAHGSERFHGVAGQIRPEQILIDLVGLARRRTDIRGSYEGICW